MKTPERDYWLAVQERAVKSWHFDPATRKWIPPIQDGTATTFIMRGVKPDPDRRAFHVFRSRISGETKAAVTRSIVGPPSW
jgi:hypothetical protein